MEDLVILGITRAKVFFGFNLRAEMDCLTKNFFRITLIKFALMIPICTPNTAYGQTIRYVHTDGLGSVSVVTNVDRNVIERREYEPYGNSLGIAVDGVGYTGHITDVATGFNYMQQRYYDPAIGRFLSVDPVEVLDGSQEHFNRYAYAYNNPYRFTDPDGRCPVCVVVLNMAKGAAFGAAFEIGMQVAVDGKRSWSEIDKSDVAVAAGIGAVLPGGMSVAVRAKSVAPTVSRSINAIRALSKQARNTTARAEKLAAREAQHVQNVSQAAGDVAATAGAAATGVGLKRIGQEAANQDNRKDPPPPPPLRPQEAEKASR
ncbi:RHS repeat domain-containing protein [Xanthomonas arboricola]|uniref:RHS repeat domain-containing protein n=1 Tax=Xanthomonas arboricola TaxID=56448 RepID=UPI003EBC0EEE